MRVEPLEPGLDNQLVYPSEEVLENHEVEFRQFFCPECAVLVSYEMCLADEPLLDDIDVDLETGT
jgi:acetone carboxylase gamma subunit